MGFTTIHPLSHFQEHMGISPRHFVSPLASVRAIQMAASQLIDAAATAGGLANGPRHDAQLRVRFAMLNAVLQWRNANGNFNEQGRRPAFYSFDWFASQ